MTGRGPLVALLALLTIAPAPAVAQSAAGVVDALPFRELGPTLMGGRVADLDVHPDNPAHWYVGFASGGLWRTTSHGMSWEPLWDDQPNASIGDVTLAPSNSNVIWVGTGEPQNRQSSPYGGGVYRSVDGGRTWVDVGLGETHHIGKIVVHPQDPDVAW
ncbi:MAG: glycosyl hydrolase, partial [Gemmatimonadota bacterium]